MNVARSLRRAIRPVWIGAAAAVAFSNRAAVRRALGFGKKPTTVVGAPVVTTDDKLVVHTFTATEEVKSWD